MPPQALLRADKDNGNIRLDSETTIREKFTTYRFADFKEKVIDLLMRVTRVRIETMKIVEAMRGARR